MSNKIKVILAKASWCPHCTNFMPIYEKVSEDYGDKYEFSHYDFADDASSPNKANFENDHNELINSIEGYPTIILKNNKSHITIEPTVIRNNNIEKAVSEFMNNIELGIKTLKSDRKKEYINLEGGYSISREVLSKSDDIFKHKYMKYKEKYHKLKNKS